MVDNTKAVSRLLPIFAVLPCFWMLFDQQVCLCLSLYLSLCERREESQYLEISMHTLHYNTLQYKNKNNWNK